MRSFESSKTAIARLLPGLLLGSLGAGCNARLDISDEPSLETPLSDGGSGGTSSISNPSAPDAGPPQGSCQDGIRTGEETDIDCGGDTCIACATGASCQRHTDCTSGACLAGVCVATNCEDGVRNGNETGVDCGGDCARCRTSACNCASSPALMPLECDETEGYLSTCGARGLLSADGEIFVFAMCHLDSPNGSTTDVKTYRRKSDGTRDVLGEAGALALSSDGQRLLIYDGSTVSMVNADGTRTVVPIPEAFSTDVRMTADGVSVFGGVPNGAGARRLARWTDAGGLETLGDFPLLADAVSWELGAVSHDGTVIVGSADDGTGLVPFRWTAADGLEPLGTLPEGVTAARPTVISADGSTVAGFTGRNPNTSDIFRWTATDQLQIMGAAVPLASFANAGTLLLSTDGGILAGAALVNGAISVVRWGTGGTAVPSSGLFVTDMTADGSVLVGIETAAVGFLWRPPVVELTTPASAYEVTHLDALLQQSGADGAGWALESVTNISDDGHIIYGTGTCGGVPTYYRMQLRP
jgi:uncharacterized membrane protein